MTNFDKYKSKIMEMGSEFAVHSSTLGAVSCQDFDCEQCLFYNSDDLCGCGNRMLRWLCEDDDKPVVDWSIIPVDTRVLVSDDGEYWRPRYFAGVDSNGSPMVWSGGTASWTAGNDTVVYGYIKMAEEG